MDTRNSATLRRQQGHLNTTEMADHFNINRHTYFYWMTHGLVPKPTITFSGKRRYYSTRDIEVVRTILEAKNE